MWRRIRAGKYRYDNYQIQRVDKVWVLTRKNIDGHFNFKTLKQAKHCVSSYELWLCDHIAHKIL